MSSEVNSERKQKGKVMVGKVVSDKMMKTVVVVVETRRRHPLYGKIITVRRRFKAHNEEPKAKAGDTVKIVESRPLSRDKRWRVTEIVRTGEVVEMIRETELESLIEKERTEKAARKADEQQRAADRLVRLGGFESVEEMQGANEQPGEFASEYEGSDSDESGEEGDEE
jgi:small subunit ribosomal protein S17